MNIFDILEKRAREKIESIEESAAGGPYWIKNNCYYQTKGAEDIIEVIKNLKSELGFDKRDSGQEINQGWVSCSKKLPKEHEDVWITTVSYLTEKPACNHRAVLVNGEWYWSNTHDKVNVQVLAWRRCEVPMPYQPE